MSSFSTLWNKKCGGSGIADHKQCHAGEGQAKPGDDYFRMVAAATSRTPPSPDDGPEAYSAWMKKGENLPTTHPLGTTARKVWAQLSLGAKTVQDLSDKELETAAYIGRLAPKHDITTDKLRAISDELTRRKAK